MTNDDHAGRHKVQCWIPQELWDKVDALNIPNQTIAVIKALELLVQDSQNIPDESPDIPALRAQVEGLQLLLQEKQERITDLKKENERLDFYALYFKSQDYKRLENPAEVIKAEVQKAFEKPVREARSTPEGRSETEIIKKTCKNCNQVFETTNPKKETCSDKCRSAFSRRKK